MPFTRTCTTPPRAEAWYPVISLFPRRDAQYGPSTQCAEPVTGSSGTPTRGAKNRDTKSYAPPAERAVTMNPRPSTFASAAKSGAIARTASSLGSSTSTSNRLRPIHVNRVPSAL